MDPVSIVGLIGTLIPLCIKTSRALNDVKTRYAQSSITVSSMISECAVITSALNQIEKIAKKDTTTLSSKLGSDSTHLSASLELALEGCSTVLITLNEEIEKVTGVEKSRFLTWKSKLKYVWNEDGMKDLLVTLRGQQSALHLLIAAIQTDSLADMQRMLSDNNAVLHTMVHRAQSLREKRAASTMKGVDTEFEFDDQLISSAAYRRAFRSFVKVDQSSAKIDASPEKNANALARPLPAVSVTEIALVVQKETSVTSTSRKPVADSIPKIEESTEGIDVKAGLKSRIRKSTRPMRPSQILNDLFPPKESKIVTERPPVVETTGSKPKISRLAAIREDPDLGGDSSTQMSPSSPSSSLSGETMLPMRRLNQLLRTATERGDSNMMRILIGKGADLQHSYPGGYNLLVIAASNGHLKALKLLYGLSSSDNNLMFSSWRYNMKEVGERLLRATCCHSGTTVVDVARYLVANRKVNPFEVGADGSAPIHYVAAFSDADMMNFFITELGVDVNAKDTYGNTPSHIAAQHGNLETLKYLWETRGRRNYSNVQGLSPLHYAAACDRADSVEFMLKQDSDFDLEWPAVNGWSPLNYAVASGGSNVVKVLLERGVSFSKPRHATDLIHIMAKWSCEEAFVLLLEKGFEPELELNNTGGSKPLHLAAEFGNLQMVNKLLGLGARIDGLSSQKQTALHRAAEKGHLGVVNALLNHGARTNIVDASGMIPLHSAALSGCSDCAVRLIDENWRDLETLTTSTHSTALALAVYGGHERTVCMLAEKGADTLCAKRSDNIQPQVPIFIAIGKNQPHLIPILKGLGSDLEVKIGEIERTPLMEAVIQGNKDAVKALLECGVNVNAVNAGGTAAVQSAALLREPEILELLISYGADITLKDALGIYPVHVAAMEASLACMKGLVAAGANVNVKTADNYGAYPMYSSKTALDFAVEGGHVEMVEYLFSLSAD